MTLQDKYPCPCNSGKLYTTCCEPLLSGNCDAISAEALMRSRFTAYVKRDISYILNTWHASTRPANINSETIPKWSGLHIISIQLGTKTDLHGFVEFRATSISQEKALVLNETSRFVKERGQWFYIDGIIKEETPENLVPKNTGRNEPCPCNSGKKFKKCCGP